MYEYQFKLLPSRFFLSLLFALHAGAVICLVYTGLPSFIVLLSTITLMIFQSFYHLKMRRWKKLVWREKNYWEIYDAKGASKILLLQGSSILSRWIVILNFKHELKNRHFSLVVFPDTMSAKDFRHLRLCMLRH